LKGKFSFCYTSVSWIGVENRRSQPAHWHWISLGSINGANGFCWMIAIGLSSVVVKGDFIKVSGNGENDNGRLPFPSLDDSDGVDKRESKERFDW